MRWTVALVVLLTAVWARAQVNGGGSPPATSPPALLPSSEPARTVEHIEADVTRRTMHGHTFLLPATIDSAFVQTTFTTRTSVRYGVVSDIPIGPLTFDLTSIGARETFDFGLAFGDTWEIGALAFGQFLTGTNGRSLATQGALYGYGGALHGAVRIARIESSGTQIGARAQLVGVEGGERFSLLPLIRAIKNDPARSIPDIIGNFGETLSTSVSWLDFGLSVDVAQTITRAFSLQGMFRLDVQTIRRSPFVQGQGRVDLNSTKVIPSGGVALGLNPVDFPVAFMGEYRLSALNSDDLTSLSPRHVVALGVYYSGRPNLQLGPVFFGEFGLLEVQGIDANGNPASSNEGKAFVGQLMMTYYW